MKSPHEIGSHCELRDTLIVFTLLEKLVSDYTTVLANGSCSYGARVKELRSICVYSMDM